MIDPFSRTSRLTPQQWKFRARVIQAHLDRFSLDELMRGGRAGEAPHLGEGGSHGRGYDPNQPRVPAGHSDGGQWTSVGSAHARAIEPNSGWADQRAFALAGRHDNIRPHIEGEPNFVLANYIASVEQPQQASVEVQHVRSPDAGTRSAWRRYAELGRLSAEDKRAVEETTRILTNVLFDVNQRASRRRDLVTPSSYGTAVHTEFAAAVRSLNLPGIGTVGVEQSFDPDGDPTYYGKKGSIRTDVVLRNAEGVIIAIYEVKTGDAEMRSSTKQKYRDYTKVSPYVQIIILRARRGQR